jgi:tRNA-2-methylthio-N6-dimethylallyladenosine synthase
MNISDSERITSALNNAKYKPASEINEADLIVVNMCSVRQSAVDRIYGKIQDLTKLKKENPNIKTLITGCISKKDAKKFEKYFDYVLSIKTLNHWKDFLRTGQSFYYPPSRDSNFGKKFTDQYLKLKPVSLNKFSFLIPISIGCNNFCSFCVVPFARGPQINRNHREIIKEVKLAIKNGAKEIWLLGQNVNSYNSPELIYRPSKSKGRYKSGNINFPKLLKMVNSLPGNFWIRFTSSHPKDFSDELVEAMESCKKATNYLNLPVQAGDDEILKKMNRPYTVQYYKKLVKKIREKIPDICLSTDVIVGFPGETKKQFKNTCKLFKEIKFDMAYIAKYSPRPQTLAGRMKDGISRKEKEERKKILNGILKKTSLENNKKYVGKIVEVLPENFQKEFLIGKTRSYKTIKFKGSKSSIGKFIKLKITNALPWGLEGKTI